ncbi:MAG: phage protein [Methylococcales bacterium]
MSHKHLSAQDFDIMVGNLLIHVESMSATISDNRQAVMTRGVPNGYVDGDVSCSGDIEIDTKNFNNFVEVARSRGSFRDVQPFDIIYNGKNISGRHQVALFGCLINVSDLLSNDPKGGEKLKHKLTFTVTSPDFVRINGVPYLSAKDVRDL